MTPAGAFLTGQIPPSASPVQEILYPERRSGGPDLHRHHRPDQGGGHLSARQEHQAGHLRLPVHSERDPDVPAQDLIAKARALL